MSLVDCNPVQSKFSQLQVLSANATVARWVAHARPSLGRGCRADCVAVAATAEDLGLVVSERCDPVGSTAPLATTTADGNLDRDGGVAMSGGLFGTGWTMSRCSARLAAASIDDTARRRSCRRKGRGGSSSAGGDAATCPPITAEREAADHQTHRDRRCATSCCSSFLALLLSQLKAVAADPAAPMLGATYCATRAPKRVASSASWPRRRAAGRRTRAGGRGDPDRLHPIRRDHGDRPSTRWPTSHSGRASSSSSINALDHHRRGVRKRAVIVQSTMSACAQICTASRFADRRGLVAGCHRRWVSGRDGAML